MDEQKCKHCQATTNGYRCADCGEESETHKDDHSCGGDRCQPKCGGCSEAEGNCSCGPNEPTA